MRLRYNSRANTLLLVSVIIAASTCIYGWINYPLHAALVNKWEGPNNYQVSSGYCSRLRGILPRMNPDPPEILKIGNQSFVRDSESRLPVDAQYQGYKFRRWLLYKSGEDGGIYLVTEDGTQVTKYEPGSCN